MHRKRVTSELHDNYFCLMTIKHAIPRIEWAMEWALNYYITQSRQEVRQLELETRCGKGSHARPKRPLGPLMSWGPKKLLIRCDRESHSRSKGPSGLPVVLETHWWQDMVEKASTQQKAESLGLRLSSPGERERHNADGHTSGGQYIAVYVRSPTPSHTQTLSSPFWTLTIKWEVHIFIKKSSLVLYHCVVVILSAWICIWQYNSRTICPHPPGSTKNIGIPLKTGA